MGAEYFWSQLEKLGLECVVPKEHRLPSLTTVKIPDGIDGMKVIAQMREEFQIEIGGALGSLKGKAWRIGFMGYNSRKEIVRQVTSVLKECIDAQKVVTNIVEFDDAPYILTPSSVSAKQARPVAVPSRSKL